VPERETVGDWSQGVPLEKAQALIAYWRDKYDWRRLELASTPSHNTGPRSTGSAFTFIHVRSLTERAADHSHARMAGIGRRVHGDHRAAQRTHPLRGSGGRRVPCRRPSLPGFGFSDQPVETGWMNKQDRPRLGDADAAPRLRPLGAQGGGLGRA